MSRSQASKSWGLRPQENYLKLHLLVTHQCTIAKRDRRLVESDITPYLVVVCCTRWTNNGLLWNGLMWVWCQMRTSLFISVNLQYYRKVLGLVLVSDIGGLGLGRSDLSLGRGFLNLFHGLGHRGLDYNTDIWEKFIIQLLSIVISTDCWNIHSTSDMSIHSLTVSTPNNTPYKLELWH